MRVSKTDRQHGTGRRQGRDRDGWTHYKSALILEKECWIEMNQLWVANLHFCIFTELLANATKIYWQNFKQWIASQFFFLTSLWIFNIGLKTTTSFHLTNISEKLTYRFPSWNLKQIWTSVKQTAYFKPKYTHLSIHTNAKCLTVGGFVHIYNIIIAILYLQ